MADEMSKNNKHSASTPNTHTHTQHNSHVYQTTITTSVWLVIKSIVQYIFSYACFTHIIYLFTADDVKLNEEKKKTQHSRWSSLRHLMPVAPDALSSVLMNFEWFFVCMFGHDGKIFVRQTAIWTDTTNRNQFVEIWITPDYKWSLQRIETSQS